MNPVVPVFLLRVRRQEVYEGCDTNGGRPRAHVSAAGFAQSLKLTRKQGYKKKMKKRSCCSANSGSVPAMTSSLRFTPYASLFTLHGNVYQG